MCRQISQIAIYYSRENPKQGIRHSRFGWLPFKSLIEPKVFHSMTKRTKLDRSHFSMFLETCMAKHHCV